MTLAIISDWALAVNEMPLCCPVLSIQDCRQQSQIYYRFPKCLHLTVNTICCNENWTTNLSYTQSAYKSLLITDEWIYYSLIYKIPSSVALNIRTTWTNMSSLHTQYSAQYNCNYYTFINYLPSHCSPNCKLYNNTDLMFSIPLVLSSQWLAGDKELMHCDLNKSSALLLDQLLAKKFVMGREPLFMALEFFFFCTSTSASTHHLFILDFQLCVYSQSCSVVFIVNSPMVCS